LRLRIFLPRRLFLFRFPFVIFIDASAILPI